MKKAFLFIIIALCIAVPELPAQRYLPGMRGLQVAAGTVNGLNPETGFHAGAAFSQYTKSADRWVFGVEYLEKRHPYRNIYIPQSQFTADSGYYLKFLSDRRKTFFLSLGASAMAGYETVNRNSKLLSDGATITDKAPLWKQTQLPEKKRSFGSMNRFTDREKRDVQKMLKDKNHFSSLPERHRTATVSTVAVLASEHNPELMNSGRH